MWGIALSQSADEILPKVKPKKYFYEFGLNAVTIQKRLFRGYNYSLQDKLIPYFTPGVYFKMGTRKRVLRVCANYYHAVGQASIEGLVRPASIYENQTILLSYQEAELRVGYQRYWRPFKKVQPYYVCDVSFSILTEKAADQYNYYYSAYNAAYTYATALSQLWGVRANLFSNLYLNADTGFTLVYQRGKSPYWGYTTAFFPRWVAINIGLGLKI